MIGLGVADLVIIAGRTLGMDTSEVLDLLDSAAAEQALAQARSVGVGAPPAMCAAALLEAMLTYQPLGRGDRQLALAAMLQFLALNGWELDPYPASELAAVVTGLSDGSQSLSGVSAWLASRLYPSSPPVSEVKETSMRSRIPLPGRLRKATTRAQPRGMFTRFTGQAVRAVHLCQEEARLLRHAYIGTEHLLLSLLYQGEGIAAEALASLGISREAVRGQLEQIVGLGASDPAPGHLPFTPRSKKVLELSLREAMRLGHHQIGTEHLLLGIIREGEGMAAQVLVALGTDLPGARDRVLAVLHAHEEAGWPVRAPHVASELVNVSDRLAEVRRHKEAAFEAGELDVAAAFRDRERDLLSDQGRLEHELTASGDLTALIAENRRLLADVDRLRDLMRMYGIEPDGGSARSA
jgi:prophage maintenance system killer protein